MLLHLTHNRIHINATTELISSPQWASVGKELAHLANDTTINYILMMFYRPAVL